MFSDVALACAIAAAFAGCANSPRTNEQHALSRNENSDASRILVGATSTDAAVPAPDAYLLDEEVEQRLSSFAGEDGHGIGGAIEWLVAHPDRARPAIVAALQDFSDRGFHVKFLLRTLGLIANPDDVPLLRRWFLAECGTTCKYEAATALQLNPSDVAVDVLIEGLTVADERTVSKAVSALGRRGAERARHPIEQLLGHAELPVRLSAIDALVALGVEPSRAKLTEHQKVETDQVVLDRLAEVLGP